jgi:hypothetical protein
MSDTFEQPSTLQYNSYNDITKPVLKDGFVRTPERHRSVGFRGLSGDGLPSNDKLINNPTPRVENADEKKASMDAVKEEVGETTHDLQDNYQPIANMHKTTRGLHLIRFITGNITEPTQTKKTHGVILSWLFIRPSTRVLRVTLRRPYFLSGAV